MAVFRVVQRFHGHCNGNARIKAFSLTFIQKRFLSDSKVVSNGDDTVLPILIVGAGQVGLVLSVLLTKLGVKCAVLEKTKNFSKHPQAHFINNRSMGFFANWMAWQRRYRGTNHQWSYGESSYLLLLFLVRFLDQWTICNLKLENLNFEVRTSEGLEAHNHGILQERQILMGHECLSIDGSDVTVTASFSKDGKYRERNFKCNILVGADGAGSTVCKLVGIDMKGEKELQKLVSVHFLSRVFGQYLLNERPGMLFFIFNTEAIAVLVAPDLKQGEFVFQILLFSIKISTSAEH